MTPEDYDELLLNARIRPTAVRILVLRALDSASAPLSGQELEIDLGSVDRSSISRTLSVFAESGVVHTVDDGSGSVKYELCRSHDASGGDADRHPHFHCLGCGITICLDNIGVPEVDIPQGYEPVSVNYVVKGFCPVCSAKKYQGL